MLFKLKKISEKEKSNTFEKIYPIKKNAEFPIKN